MESRSLCSVALVVGFCLMAVSTALFAQCGENSPAFPVPEFRNSVRLWPDGFRPALPDRQLPADRDSTQYRSLSQPNALSGHELFRGLDIADDRLFVVYSNGLSAWEIDPAFPSQLENPRRRAFLDGHQPGHWLHFEGAFENDGPNWDVSALSDPDDPDRIFVATASTTPIGLALWSYRKSTGSLTALYQNTGPESQQVRLVEVGGRIYAFAISSGTNQFSGINVFDVSAAASLLEPCLINTEDNFSTCPAEPQVFRGRVAQGATISASGRALSLIRQGSAVFVATAYGGFANSAGVQFPEIWEVPDPANPESALLRLRGTAASFSKATHAVELFEKGGNHYLALVNASDRRFLIYPVDDCLDGCASLPSPAFERNLTVASNPEGYFLTYSKSLTKSFLYITPDTHFQKGPAGVEGLWDLTNLGGSNQLTEITASGETYTDTCNVPPLSGIGYWADYYARNEHGLRNFSPRRGKFNGRSFYRTTVAAIDVHVRDVIADPTVTTTAITPPPYWFGMPIDFLATAENCAGAETWTFFANDTNGMGLGANDQMATLNFHLCAGTDCPEKTIEVWALKQACQNAGNLQEQRASITVAEPRPQVRSLQVAPAGSSFPLGKVLAFSAEVDGRPPLSYAWSVTDGSGLTVASGSGPSFVWNTAGTELGLFGDGFETGDLSRWDQAFGLTEFSRIGVSEGVSSEFIVELVLTNSPATAAESRLSRTITLVALID